MVKAKPKETSRTDLVSCYLIIGHDRRYRPRFSRATHNKPALKQNEVAVRVLLRFPEGVFKRTVPVVTVGIDGPHVIFPKTDVEVTPMNPPADQE